ncbi:MAG: thiamine phosphate synthase [Pseudolabrys sp.]
MRARVPRGLYAITDPRLTPEPILLERVAAAIAGGAAMVQYRHKAADAATRRREAAALLALCRAHDVPLIVNDDLALARALGADGVHLGQGDADPGAAREALGAHALIGVSCYNEIERARRACAAGADYVAFGRFFASRTKPEAVHAEPTLLTRARAELDRPIVAIGGITPDNGAQLIAAGADMLAVIDALFGRSDVEAAARRIAGLFE